MQAINGATRQGIILSKQVGEDFIVAPAVVRQHCDHTRDVLGNRALGVEKGGWDTSVALCITPRDELASVEQIKDAGNWKVQLLSYLLER